MAGLTDCSTFVEHYVMRAPRVKYEAALPIGRAARYEIKPVPPSNSAALISDLSPKLSYLDGAPFCHCGRIAPKPSCRYSSALPSGAEDRANYLSGRPRRAGQTGQSGQTSRMSEMSRNRTNRTDRTRSLRECPVCPVSVGAVIPVRPGPARRGPRPRFHG